MMRVKRVVALAAAVTCIVGSMAACGAKENSKTVAGGKTQAAANFDASASINVISREEGSGTRGAFVELFGIEEKDAAGNKIDNTIDSALINSSTSAMMTAVAGDKDAIGYISLGSLNDTVKAVKIEDTEATVDNIKSGAYSIARPFNVATKDNLSEAAQDFMTYIMSTEGQKVITDNGYISVVVGTAYESKNLSGKVVVAGSSSITPVMEKIKEAYEKLNPSVTVEIQESDSTTGMKSTIDGICDIGMASRELKDSETSSGIKGTKIAMDGIAVIVSKENTTDSLSKDQVKAIYTGEATTWEEATK